MLLLRAGIALLVLIVSVTLGTLIIIGRMTNSTPLGGLRLMLARFLAIAGAVLLAFAVLWPFTGNPTKHST